MTRFDHDDDDVVVIVGSGAGGGTLANELCQRGLRVVLLEAGPYLRPEDYINDEWPSFMQMAWGDPRTASGSWRVARDFPNLPAWIVKAVGGTSTHWAGVCPRIKAHELATRTAYGEIEGANLLDWPLSIDELSPYYDRAEVKMGVTHRQGNPPLPANNNYKVFANGAERIGYRQYATGPYATNAVPYDGRPGSIQDGFNFQGDKNTSKWSSRAAEIPKAESTGRLDLRPESHVIQVLHDSRGHVTGVLYLDRGGALRRQRASVVCVAGNSIETPRLLLLSASALFPDGLANSSGQVGCNYMQHATGSVYGQFEQPVRMYRGETMAGNIADESRLDTDRGFVGGYYMQTIALGPAFFASFVAPKGWGPEFTDWMDRYAYTAGLWICGEDMPREHNRVTLNTGVLDQHGLPVADVHVDPHANDMAMVAHAVKQGRAIFEAVGAQRTIVTPAYPATHNLGTCRMSARPADGVVNRFGQAHDVPNLFVSDGSQFTTSAAANPTMTIVALAVRQAEYIAGAFRAEQSASTPTRRRATSRAAKGA